MNRKLLCLALALPWPALAQEDFHTPPPGADVRARAWEVLTQGAHAPRPKLPRSAVDHARIRVDRKNLSASQRSVCSELVLEGDHHRFIGYVRFNQRLDLISYFSVDGELKLTSEGRARRMAELKRRALPKRRLQAIAKAFLGRFVPDYAARRFRVRSQGLTENWAQYALRLEEVVAPGTVAVYPNRIHIALNPETGTVVHFLQTAVHEPLREAPAITVEAARRLAVQRVGPVEAPELLLIIKKNRPVPVWLIAPVDPKRDLLLLSATSGEPVEFGETYE